MFIFGDMVLDIQEAIMDQSEETETSIYRWGNMTIRELSDRHEWAGLRNESEISPDANGIVWLPADFSKGLMVYTSDRSYRFYQSPDNESHAAVTMQYRSAGMRLTASSSFSATCTQGSSSAAVTGDLSSLSVGDAVSFSGVSGMFAVEEIDSDAGTITVWPWFPASDGSYTMNHPSVGQRKIELFDSNGDVYTSDVLVIYQRLHPAVVNGDSPVLVDFYMSMYYRILQHALEQEKYMTDSKRLELDARRAFDNDVNSEDESLAPLVPRGMPGHVNTFNMRSRKRGSFSGFGSD